MIMFKTYALLVGFVCLCFMICYSKCETQVNETADDDDDEDELHRYPLLIISLDGLGSTRFENYIKKYPNSAFNKMIASGVKAEYMIPIFPTLTFPNHYSMVTGLYSESHGIIGNHIYDPNDGEKVDLIRDQNGLDIKWWDKAEPVWLTARNQNLKTAASYWPGTGVITRTTDIWMNYDSSIWNTFTNYYDLNKRIEDVVGWIKKFEIDLTLFHNFQPDIDGHFDGPDSLKYEFQLNQSNQLIESLIRSLEEAAIYNTTNVIILSDHGMVATNKENCSIKIGNYVNDSLVDYNKTILDVVSHIYPLQGYEKDVYNALKNIPNVDVYNKSEIPKRFHYSKSDRIGPIVVVASEGYMLTRDSDCLKGDHGYNNTLASMRSIFIARGPNFAVNETLVPFENVNIYPLICELLKLECNKNNGSIDIFKNILVNSSMFNSKNSSKLLISLQFIIITLFTYLKQIT